MKRTLITAAAGLVIAPFSAVVFSVAQAPPASVSIPVGYMPSEYDCHFNCLPPCNKYTELNDGGLRVPQAASPCSDKGDKP